MADGCKDEEDALTSSLRSCANDPDFAVICAFLQKFSNDLGLDVSPNFKQLQEWLTNTDEVSDRLRDLHIKLLRKTRKTVHEKSWENSLSKFCFTYCAQDAWEVERFGYKKSGLKVKLRIFRELLESQFESNVKFRAKILGLSAESLRSQPIGRDRLGHTYWLTRDSDCNLRIYQEHLDEEIWQVVATNRDEFVNLIARLRGNEVVLPSVDIGVVDEDSSSNSCMTPMEKPPPPEEREDSQEEEVKVPNLRIKLANGNNVFDKVDTSRQGTSEPPHKAEDSLSAGAVEKKEECDKELANIGEESETCERRNGAEETQCTDKSQAKKVMPLLITQFKFTSTGSSLAVSSTKKRTLEDVVKSPPVREEQPKRPRPTLLDSKRTKKPSRYEKAKLEDDEDGDDEDDDDENGEEEEEDPDDDVEEDSEEEDMDSAAAEEDENEEKDIEEDDDTDADQNVGAAIEEPTFRVRGEGGGAVCDGGNAIFLEILSNGVSEELDGTVLVGAVIEEAVLYVAGAGDGATCLVGNTKNEAASDSAPTIAGGSPMPPPTEPKATFFFGQAGCLKLSPIKQQTLSQTQSMSEIPKQTNVKAIEKPNFGTADKEAGQKHSNESKTENYQRYLDDKKESGDSDHVVSPEKQEEAENCNQILQLQHTKTNGNNKIEVVEIANVLKAPKNEVKQVKSTSQGKVDVQPITKEEKHSIELDDKESASKLETLEVKKQHETDKSGKVDGQNNEKCNDEDAVFGAIIGADPTLEKMQAAETKIKPEGSLLKQLHNVPSAICELREEQKSLFEEQEKQPRVEETETKTHASCNVQLRDDKSQNITDLSQDRNVVKVEVGILKKDNENIETGIEINQIAKFPGAHNENFAFDKILKLHDEIMQNEEAEEGQVISKTQIGIKEDVQNVKHEADPYAGAAPPEKDFRSSMSSLEVTPTVEIREIDTTSEASAAASSSVADTIDIGEGKIKEYEDETVEQRREPLKELLREKAEKLQIAVAEVLEKSITELAPLPSEVVVEHLLEESIANSPENVTKMLANETLEPPESESSEDSPAAAVSSLAYSPSSPPASGAYASAGPNSQSRSSVIEAEISSHAAEDTLLTTPLIGPANPIRTKDLYTVTVEVLQPQLPSSSLSALAAKPILKLSEEVVSSKDEITLMKDPGVIPFQTIEKSMTQTDPYKRTTDISDISASKEKLISPSSHLVEACSLVKQSLSEEISPIQSSSFEDLVALEYSSQEPHSGKKPPVEKISLEERSRNERSNKTCLIAKESQFKDSSPESPASSPGLSHITEKSLPGAVISKNTPSSIEGVVATNYTAELMHQAVQMAGVDAILPLEPQTIETPSPSQQRLITEDIEKSIPVVADRAPRVEVASIPVEEANPPLMKDASSTGALIIADTLVAEPPGTITQTLLMSNSPSQESEKCVEPEINSIASIERHKTLDQQLSPAVTPTKGGPESAAVNMPYPTNVTEPAVILATNSSINKNNNRISSSISTLNSSPSLTGSNLVAGQTNRKRRLVDFIPSHRYTTSESECDTPDRLGDCVAAIVVPTGEHDVDVGGKRLKMRPKSANTELRKKFEAQKTAIEDTTSSSGEEDLRRRRKIITPRKQIDKGSACCPKEQQGELENTLVPDTEELPLDLKTSQFDEDHPKSVTHIDLTKSNAVPLKVAGLPMMTKQKPTLAEIIEKKLKKIPEKLFCATDASSSSVENALLTFASPKKSPITKPLKKSLLTQLRLEESDEEAVPRKRTISENMTTALLEIHQPGDAPLGETPCKGTLERCLDEASQKLKRHTLEQRGFDGKTADRRTPERQRKRRSSDELKPFSEHAPLSSFPEASVSEKLKKNNEEPESTTAASKVEPHPQVETLQQSKLVIELKIQPENTISPLQIEQPLIGRRSGRRGGAAVVYSELPQAKRTRGGSKAGPTVKKDDVKSEKKALLKKPTTEQKSMELPPCSAVAGVQLISDEELAVAKPNLKLCTGDSAEVVASMSSAAATAILGTPPTPSAIKTSLTANAGRGSRRHREVDTTNIIDPSDSTEAPVRQSRRIALQKIREEAERRKMEEIALRSMKLQLKQKKKAEQEADSTIQPPSMHSSSISASDNDDEEASEVETKKRKKKKCPGKNGSWSSGSEEQEEPEEEEEPPHYESDPGSPLFKSDHEFSPESDLEDDMLVPIPLKRARTARKEDAEESDAEEEEACQKCGKSDHPEWILLCDSCDKGYHCSCLLPVLFYIPEGDWYCPPCQQAQLINALEQHLLEYDDLMERKRCAAEEEQQRCEAEAERLELELLAAEQERQHRRERKKGKRDDSSEGISSEDEEEKLVGKHKKKDVSEDVRAMGGVMRKTTKKEPNDHNKRRRGDGRHRRRAAQRGDRQRRRRHRSVSDNGSASTSASDICSASSTSSSSASDSDDEPIYKLRKRRQINVSYRLNEYDDLINSALKKEMDEVAGAGNLGRGKDITTIIEADKEGKPHQEQDDEEEEENKPLVAVVGIAADNFEKGLARQRDTNPVEHEEKSSNDDDDDEPIKRIVKPQRQEGKKKKPRKLTTLDISSEEDHASDEDFKTSSFDDDEEEEDTSVSVSTNSDSSLDFFRRRGRGGKDGKRRQRKAARMAARERRKDRRFVVEESDEEEEQQPVRDSKKKKKRKSDTDYTESDEEEEISDATETMNSADLCDDTSSENSDGAWKPSSQRKKSRKPTISGGGASTARKSPKLKKPAVKKTKRIEYSDDDISETEEEDEEEDDVGVGGGKGAASGKQPRSQPLKTGGNSTGGGCGSGTGKGKGKGKSPASNADSSSKKKRCTSAGEDSGSSSGDSARRTRGRRYAYLEDFDDDSSEGGIKPGVKRPDTPPEERQKFIERQEEIKRMLAAKNAEGAKLAATPCLMPIKAAAIANAGAPERDKRVPLKPGVDSLSTVPLSVIRQAKVLDIDYLQRKGEPLVELAAANAVAADDDVASEFDDADLPDDFPEDMDEDAIARMVDEEEAAYGGVRDLPAADEVLRNTKVALKVTALQPAPSTTNPSLAALAQLQGSSMPSGLQEPLRKRLPMPTLHPPLLRHQFPSTHMALPTAQLVQRQSPSSQLLQHALSAPLGQSLVRNFAPPHLSAQRLPGQLPPHLRTGAQSLAVSQLLQVPSDVLQDAIGEEDKPRGRRKKITPLRDALQKQQTAAAASAAISTTTPGVKPTTSIATASSLAMTSESVIKSALSTSVPALAIAQTSQHYKSSGIAVGGETPTQPSVITRMPLLASGRSLVPPSGMYAQGSDVSRFYPATPSHQLRPPPPHAHSQSQSVPPRHRLPPQMAVLQPTHHSMRPTYGPPPPLRGVSAVPSHVQQSQLPPISMTTGGRSVYAPSTQASEHHATAHLSAVYGSASATRSAAPHLNPYRPHIYGNPNYSPVRGAPSGANIRPVAPPHSAEYVTGARPYPPYGYYPPPPPLTAAHQPALATHVAMPSAPSSVIVSATPTAVTNHALTTSLQRAQHTKSPPASLLNSKSIVDSRKKLTTLEAYSTVVAKSPLVLGGESSGSRSSPGMQVDANEDSSSAPVHSIASAATTTASEASEFSGLVSYFSSQHDDYNS